MWQSELWQRRLTPEDADTELTLGGYLYSQYGFSNGIQLGLRFDYYTVQNLKNVIGETVENSRTALVPGISYQNSEFANFRMAYRLGEEKTADGQTLKANVLEIQSTFILGAHPSHDF